MSGFSGAKTHPVCVCVCVHCVGMCNKKCLATVCVQLLASFLIASEYGRGIYKVCGKSAELTQSALHHPCDADQTYSNYNHNFNLPQLQSTSMNIRKPGGKKELNITKTDRMQVICNCTEAQNIPQAEDTARFYK